MPTLRCSWNANTVVLDFPATTAPSWVEPAIVSSSSEVNNWQNVPARRAVCPAVGCLRVIRGSYQYCSSDMKRCLHAQAAGTEAVCVDIYNEIQGRTEAVRFLLWACHLQIHHPRSNSAPSHSVSSVHPHILKTARLRGHFAFKKQTVCSCSNAANIFSSDHILTGWICSGWARNWMKWDGMIWSCAQAS